MPTGYTSGLTTETSFPEFAMKCARAFGALIEMRDEPADAPIPEFKPSDYHCEALAKARVRLAELQQTPDEQLRERMRAKWEESERRKSERRGGTDKQRLAYESMLGKVRDWSPPTPDHSELRSFMIQQLEESIQFDCTVSHETAAPVPDFEAWKAKAIASATGDITHHQAEWDKEVKRVNSRNLWVKQLRESLAQK